MDSRRHILLVGAGHAHLNVIRDSRRWPRDQVCATVVSPGDFWYSGLATGTLGGEYDVEQDRVDVAALCGRVGATFVRGELSSLDTAARKATLADGASLRYDVLSLNLGSEVNVPGGFDGVGRVFRVKPIAELIDLRRAVEAGEVRGVCVVGGGYAGSECAINVAALLGEGGRVTLFAGNDGPGPDLPKRARPRLREALLGAGVTVRDVRATPADVAGFDAVLLATGLKPPGLAATLGLATDAGGHLLVDRHLRCAGHDDIFAVGDAANLLDRPLPNIGVVAVFQGRLLRTNLLRAALGGRLGSYRPMRWHLLILSLSGGRGLAVYGPFFSTGRLAMRLKRLIDLRWLASFAR